MAVFRLIAMHDRRTELLLPTNLAHMNLGLLYVILCEEDITRIQLLEEGQGQQQCRANHDPGLGDAMIHTTPV